jgi:predicted DCC family thiol-disulfide oxidoreductase YuxK
VSDQPERILIYDGQCRLCVTAKAGIEQLETTPGVRFVPYQSDEAARCMAADYTAGRPDAAFLIERDGTIRKGLDAFVPLLPGLRGGWLLLALWRVPLLRPIAYAVYRVIARYRYAWFGAVSSSAPPESSR